MQNGSKVFTNVFETVVYVHWSGNVVAMSAMNVGGQRVFRVCDRVHTVEDENKLMFAHKLKPRYFSIVFIVYLS